jgi:four helix bundle protein
MGEFVQFISNAERSAAELDTQLILSGELGLCPKSVALPVYEMIAEERRMLNSLRRKLAARTSN